MLDGETGRSVISSSSSSVLKTSKRFGETKTLLFLSSWTGEFGDDDDDERALFVGVAFIFDLRTVFLLIITIGETTLAMAIKSKLIRYVTHYGTAHMLSLWLPKPDCKLNFYEHFKFKLKFKIKFYLLGQKV